MIDWFAISMGVLFLIYGICAKKIDWKEKLSEGQLRRKRKILIGSSIVLFLCAVGKYFLTEIN
ncbi:hypothetical protein [Treponema sp. UBA3813]|jgi:hypothetical protein|uniref:hypothetical protein n=1 Tax=Treponema sp. UBA3813 TaxID=1947715 RepID=UPI0025F2B1E7|nr:hypothetical protein [Treponema sp. UBA3813]